ncbi:MAG TPA: hypothetical protein VNL15_01365, partial [Dehalococcoidia bacterium]|nr:hypothetical protein [Dehalococcoidia bacterium]
MEQQSARSLTTVGVRVGSFSLWPRSAASAAIVFALALVTYGNVYSALPANVREPYDWLFITLGFVLILPATLWVATQGISYSDIGLRTTRPYKELLVGLAVGAVVILPVVVYFLFPWGLPGGDIDYEGSKESTLGSFMVWAFLRQPLGTSIFEEVMFRGILLALSMRAFGLM